MAGTSRYRVWRKRLHPHEIRVSEYKTGKLYRRDIINEKWHVYCDTKIMPGWRPIPEDGPTWQRLDKAVSSWINDGKLEAM
ncbi:MAG: hypothetical protein ACR2QH_15225 [Geminicoccaceae bacterium]